MHSEFPRILTYLRKEKGISQKQAAQELGVSQALLSHYEKGIRECGLAFVIRTADFYDVSCDYLLGRSPEKNGSTISIEKITESSDKKEVPNPKTFAAVYNKKIIISSMNILFDLAAKSGCKTLVQEVSSFLTMAVYRMFRVVFKANKNNNEEMFSVPKELANQKAQAEMTINEANASAIVLNSLPKLLETIKSPSEMTVSMELLDNNYSEDKSALLNLIKNCEAKLSDNN